MRGDEPVVHGELSARVPRMRGDEPAEFQKFPAARG